MEDVQLIDGFAFPVYFAEYLLFMTGQFLEELFPFFILPAKYPDGLVMSS